MKDTLSFGVSFKITSGVICEFLGFHGGDVHVEVFWVAKGTYPKSTWRQNPADLDLKRYNSFVNQRLQHIFSI
jgi:hypothetical protein